MEKNTVNIRSHESISYARVSVCKRQHGFVQYRLGGRYYEGEHSFGVRADGLAYVVTSTIYWRDAYVEEEISIELGSV